MKPKSENKPDTGMELKEYLFLGFCAVFILLFRMVFRLRLHISGHSMLFMVFFLLLARGTIRNRLAATLTGTLAGIMAMILGLGKGGPLVLIKFLLPAIAVDLAALVFPGLFFSYLLCAGTGVWAGATKFVGTYILDSLIGMDRSVVLQHAFIEAVGAGLFGIVGGIMVPPVIKKLSAFGIISPQTATANINQPTVAPIERG